LLKINSGNSLQRIAKL